MGKTSRVAALLIVAAFLSGCGTVANLHVGAREGWKNARIYGGVRRDVQSAEDWFAYRWLPLKQWEVMQDLGAVVGVGLVGIDVPLSAIGDTLTLPVTIPASIWGSSSKTANVSRKAVPQQSVVSSPQPAGGSQDVPASPPAAIPPSGFSPPTGSNRATLPDGSRK